VSSDPAESQKHTDLDASNKDRDGYEDDEPVKNAPGELRGTQALKYRWAFLSGALKHDWLGLHCTCEACVSTAARTSVVPHKLLMPNVLLYTLELPTWAFWVCRCDGVVAE
jgi:hypothetical protein